MSTNSLNSSSPSPRNLGSAINLESPLVIGFSIHLCWLILLVAPTLLTKAYVQDLSLNSCFALNECFFATFAIGCFVIGAIREVITYYLRKKLVHFLIGLAGSLCLAGLFTSESMLPSGFAYIVLYTTTLLSGFFCAITTLIWGEAARRRKLKTLALTSIISLLLAGIIIVVFAYLIQQSFEIFTVVACLCPLISVIFMYKAQHDNESYLKPQEFVTSKDGTMRAKEGRTWFETTHELRISRRGFALKLGKSALPFGIAIGLLMTQMLENYEASFESLTSLVIHSILPLAGVTIFVILYFVRSSKDDQSVSVQSALPFFEAFLLISICGTYALEAQEAVLCLGVALLWMYPTEITQQYRITPMLTFGFFMGFFAIGMGISVLIAWLIPPFSTLWPWPIIACALMYLLGCATLITDQQMRSIAIIKRPSENANDQEKEVSDSNKRPFYERCQLTADIFLLSHRELEILALLAKGRNAAFIQQELVISEGTVRTHMRNIYHKLGVHSQQELINLVENIQA